MSQGYASGIDVGQEVRTIWTMRILLTAALLTGCSLYTGDDDGPADVDAGGAPSIDGAWRVEWACVDSCTVNPLAANTEVNISSAGDLTSVAWTASHVEHSGTWDGLCLMVEGGEDGGSPRASYSMCSAANSPRIMVGSVTWTGGRWRLTLQR